LENTVIFYVDFGSTLKQNDPRSVSKRTQDNTLTFKPESLVIVVFSLTMIIPALCRRNIKFIFGFHSIFCTVVVSFVELPLSVAGNS
jgi:hypothetical protein